MIITTVVVTYNRKDELLKNLEQQFVQTYKISNIIIVDNNSHDGTYEKLNSKGFLNKKNVLYFNTGDNIGGAGGFEFGLKKAYELDTDLICLMDDDGRPYDNQTIAKVVEAIEDNDIDYRNQPLFLNSLVLCDDQNISFPYNGNISKREMVEAISINGLVKDLSSPFNGTFINKKLIDIIGFPRGEFFIRFDEVDYFTKAKNCGATIAVVDKSLYFHPSTAKYQTKKFLFSTYENDYEGLWKEYYKFRNNSVLALENGKSRFKIYYRFIQRVIGLFVFNISNKKTYYLFLRKAYKDALKKRLGKTINPGQTSLKQ